MLKIKKFNKLNNIFKLSKIKKGLKVIALGIIGFSIGKFFGLGAILSGSMIYRNAVSKKISVVHRLLITILGCLVGGLIATIFGNVAMIVVPMTMFMKIVILVVISSATGFAIPLVVHNLLYKKK
ncbi:MAG: hypothetical protein HRU36_00550 [Rickettsiales bacterium]|nr:hypothetical protein [Rickettsiales bacterium]